MYAHYDPLPDSSSAKLDSTWPSNSFKPLFPDYTELCHDENGYFYVDHPIYDGYEQDGLRELM